MQNKKKFKIDRGFLRKMYLKVKRMLMLYYKHLIDKYLKQTISEEEKKVLGLWVFAKDKNMIFFKNQVANYNKTIVVDFDSLTSYHRFSEKVGLKKSRNNNFFKVLKYAAVFILLIGLGVIFTTNPLNEPKERIIMAKSHIKKEIDENAIVLTLSDGSSKVISANGEEVILDKQGNIIASKGANSMTFSSELNTNESLVFNEIFIPFGETFKLKLSDGTQVWLNAGSKLKFPQKFIKSSSNRTVYLEGEAFFDVTTNKEKPFIVNTNGVDVKVYGTQFNVSSYNDNETIAATLVEGSISLYKTESPEKEMKITPSYQGTFNKLENNFKNKKVDTDLYTDWMRNKLVINNLKFSEILTKLERRNNVKIINNAESLNNESYKGEFDDENIELILKTISMSTPFKYNVNQNIITISKK